MNALYLAVDGRTAGLTPDDRVLADALREQGAVAEPIVWGSDIASGSRVLIRSTWDYVERPGDFRAWLDRLDAASVDVINPTWMLRWNVHKSYLLDLMAAGVPTVPTTLIRKGTPIGLAKVRELTHSDRVVVKPAVGATARLTIDSGRLDRESIEQHVTGLVEGEDVVVQPYVDSITTVGEVSIVAIDGELTHAVNKRPAAGDWRVQSNFGGSSQLVEITGELRHIADAALGTIRTTPMYARIDVVYDLDRWSVLELELVEPELFFRLAPQAAARLAGRLVGL